MSNASTLRGITNKDAKAVLRKAIKAGCTVEITNGTHVRITTPSGAVVRTGLTSGSSRAGVYLRADLRRAGVDL